MSKTFSIGAVKKKSKVPKLDFSGLKHNKEFKDWYKYSITLEKSIRALREKIKNLEDDLAECNKKNQALHKQNSNLYTLNRKLVSSTKSLKKKIVEIKERYNKRVKKAQKFGINALEMTIPRFETEVTYDYAKDALGDEFDDFNSQESYDPDKARDAYSAYKTNYLSKQLSVESTEDRNERPKTEYILEQSDYYDFENLTADKVSSPHKKISCGKLKSSANKSIIEGRREASNLSSLQMPERSYQRSGLITKINLNEQNRDKLVGRKRIVRKDTLESQKGSK